jgi:Flp pilus assembly protein TadG
VLRSDRGAAALETALVLPLLTGVVALVVTAALAATVAALVDRAAEHAVRAAAVPLDPVARTYRDDAAVAAVAAAATPLLALDASDVAVTFDGTRRGEGARFAVAVSYRWDPPLSPPVVISSSATGVRE